jgi:hypothetical protein
VKPQDRTASPILTKNHLFSPIYVNQKSPALNMSGLGIFNSVVGNAHHNYDYLDSVKSASITSSPLPEDEVVPSVPSGEVPAPGAPAPDC